VSAATAVNRARVSSASVASSVASSKKPKQLPAGTFKRPPEVRRAEAMLERAVKEWGLAASTMVVVANARTTALSGVADKDMPWFDQPTRLRVGSTPATLKLTVVMCVSGHTDQASRYARSNTYSVRITMPNGSTQEFRGLKRSKSVEYVSAFDFEVPAMKGTITIEGWPEATRVGGYSEGRTVRLVV
jgi:hypothetical protein